MSQHIQLRKCGLKLISSYYIGKHNSEINGDRAVTCFTFNYANKLDIFPDGHEGQLLVRILMRMSHLTLFSAQKLNHFI